MNSYANLGKAVGKMVVLAGVAIGTGLAAAWWMGGRGNVASVAMGGNSAPLAMNSSSAPAAVPEPLPFLPPHHAAAEAAPVEAAPVPDSRTWQQKLEDILLAGGEPNEKSDKILAMIPGASPDAQVELSQHLINMTTDDHYDGVAGLLTNATTQPAVSKVLMNDLLNRHNSLKLPMLLHIARTDDHPLQGEAKDILELFIQQDYGTNWDEWSDSITSWLQQNDQ